MTEDRPRVSQFVIYINIKDKKKKKNLLAEAGARVNDWLCGAIKRLLPVGVDISCMIKDTIFFSINLTGYLNIPNSVWEKEMSIVECRVGDDYLCKVHLYRRVHCSHKQASYQHALLSWDDNPISLFKCVRMYTLVRGIGGCQYCIGRVRASLPGWYLQYISEKEHALRYVLAPGLAYKWW